MFYHVEAGLRPVSVLHLDPLIIVINSNQKKMAGNRRAILKSKLPD